MGEFDQWIDKIQKLLDDPTATDEQYLQLEQAFTDHMNQTDKKQWHTLWSGPCEMLSMICEGIQFEKVKCSILDGLIHGQSLTKVTDLYGQRLEGVMRKLKEEGLITEEERITSKGEAYWREHEGKPVIR